KPSLFAPLLPLRGDVFPLADWLAKSGVLQSHERPNRSVTRANARYTKSRRILMAEYFGALILVLMLGIVLTRVFLLRQQVNQAMKLCNLDKTGFFVPPFAFFISMSYWPPRSIGPPSTSNNFSIPR